MIIYAPSLQSRIEREIARALGSEAMLMFFTGPMPVSIEQSATGDRVGEEALGSHDLTAICRGLEPFMPDGAGYWRILDNGGIVVMQGDGDE